MNKSIASNYAKIAKEYVSQGVKAVAKDDAKGAADAFTQAVKHLSDAKEACGA